MDNYFLLVAKHFLLATKDFLLTAKDFLPATKHFLRQLARGQVDRLFDAEKGSEGMLRHPGTGPYSHRLVQIEQVRLPDGTGGLEWNHPL